MMNNGERRARQGPITPGTGLGLHGRRNAWTRRRLTSRDLQAAMGGVGCRWAERNGTGLVTGLVCVQVPQVRVEELVEGDGCLQDLGVAVIHTDGLQGLVQVIARRFQLGSQRATGPAISCAR